MASNESVYWSVLMAVRSQLNSTETLAPMVARIRRKAAFRKGHDVLPLMLVVPTVERIADEQFGGTAFFDYPVTVAIIRESKLVLEDEADIPWLLARRQEIRRKLHRALLGGASEVFDCTEYDPEPPFDPSAFDQAFDVSAQRFTFRSQENRQEG